METKRFQYCAMITGGIKTLTRDRLKREFSKFGKVTKIYINQEDSFAKVYLDTIEGVLKACKDLHKLNGWDVCLFTDKGKHNENNKFVNSNTNTSTQDQQNNYVDINGRNIEILQDEDERLYISLDDLKSAGFYVYSKDEFENSSIPKEIELDQLRQFLLNQGKNYILGFKKKFSENEILDVFQKVEEALVNPKKSTLGFNRQIHNAPSGNVSITTRNDISTTLADYARNADRGSLRVPDNVRPSVSHFTQESRSNQPTRAYQDNRNKGNNSNNRFNEQNRKPRQFQERSSNNQTTTNDGCGKKRDDTGKEERNTIPSKADLTPKVEPEILNTVNYIQETAKNSTKVKDDKHEVLPPVEEIHDAPQSETISHQEKDEKAPAAKDVSTKVLITHTSQSTPFASQPDGTTALKNQEHVLVHYSEMEYVKLPLGVNDYVCYSCTGETVYLVPMCHEIVAQLADLESVQPKDTEPYPVDLMEMCLAKFNDVWYRGLVTDLKSDNVREVLFVDYGNTEDVNVDEIRRFPLDLKNTPIFAVSARFEGIPDKQNVYDRMKELIPDQALVSVNVLQSNPDTLEYTVEVPSVYDQLRKEGLI